MTEWITNRRPAQEEADIDGDVIILEDNTECFVDWQAVREGEPWKPCDFYEKIDIKVTDDRWITSRQPVASDGNKDGAVHVRKYPDKNWGANIHWSYVGTGVPWEHTNDYEGPIEPIPFEVKPEDIPEEPILTEEGPRDDVPHRVRTFASVRRTYVGNNCIIDAIASDGTFWCFTDCTGQDPQWTQLPDLPQDQ